MKSDGAPAIAADPFFVRMEGLVIAKLILATPWLIYLGIKDYRTRRLPNVATLGASVVMLAVAFGVGVQYGVNSLISGALCALFLLLPFFLRAAGAGDVKMLFAAGLIAGPGNVLNLILLISFAGLVLAIFMLLFRAVNAARLKHYLRCLFDFKYDRKKGREALPSADSEACRVPFGVAIAAGLFLNLLLQLLAALSVNMDYV